MAQQKQSVPLNALFRKLTTVVFFFTVSILMLVVISLSITSILYLSSSPYENSTTLQMFEREVLAIGETQKDTEKQIQFLSFHTNIDAQYHGLMQNIILVLLSTLILSLFLMIYQMHQWNKDRKKLDKWRQSGFFCEHLEFLPANRIKLNNIELELNKTQIDNLKRLAESRLDGIPLHALDIGGQPIKRLREELGAKFLEKTFIKVRKREGYWLEVEQDQIHGSVKSDSSG
ncbi:MAG: hypothetical protein KAG28_01310 [Cocleimonas sp.]|nr:hypothetical protein [Cocleimonas sp.]